MPFPATLIDVLKTLHDAPNAARQAAHADFAALQAAVHLAFLDWLYNTDGPAVWQQQSPRIPAIYAALTAILHDARLQNPG